MEHGKYSVVIDAMKFSYSRLSSFDDCRYKWFMRYLLELEEDDMFYASYGKLIHSILEKFYKSEITKDEMVAEYLVRYNAEVIGERPSASVAESYFKTGLEYVRNFTPLPYKVLEVEEYAEVNIGGYKLCGFPDMICTDGNEIIVVDNKSAILKPRSKRAKPTRNDQKIDAMLVQLYIYAEFVKKKYGRYPGKFIFNLFRANTLIVEPFALERHMEIMSWIPEQIEKIKQEDDFYPTIDYFFCKNLCGLHDQCEYYSTIFKKGGV